MKEMFVQRSFSETNLRTVMTVNGILEEYERQDFRLTLRQLYYQLVARDYIENSLRSYKNLGSLVSNARQAGLIDWDMIEDRGRETVINAHWENPAEIVRAAARSFRIDKWKFQDYHIEVMVEKDALSGILEPVCRELDIRLTANKGYSSSSTMYEIGKRLEEMESRGKSITVLYLGDHDPSGIDMTRDVEDRLEMYSNNCSVEVIRLALNFDQVQKWRPPENPAKTTDSRYDAYKKLYGTSSWELDAVEPKRLADLVRDIVYERRDESLWDETIAEERRMLADLNKFSNTYAG